MTITSLERPRPKAHGGVAGSVQYLDLSRAKPEVSFETVATGETNAAYRARQVFLRDARLIAGALSLDVQGFELVDHVSAMSDYADEAEIETVGRSEAAEIVARATGASRVIVFDHTVRKRSPDAARQPSVRVHNDYTVKSAPQRVRDLMGEEADRLLEKRVAFINVWRPIHHPALDWPLALADARSVDFDELIATDIVYPGRRGEIYGLAYAPHHRWYYAPNMQIDEVLLLKNYDSETGVARFAPHTAFADATTPPDAPPRESIEYRTIAFY